MLDMKMTRVTVFVVALLASLVATQGVTTASPLTYDYSGTFDAGPLTGASYTGTFAYDTAGNPNLQTNIPLTFSLFDNYDSRQIEAHPSPIPLFTLVDGRQTGGFSLHISITHLVSPELDQPLPPTQFASVFFSPDPFFSNVSIDNDTHVELAPVPEPGTLLLLATGLTGVVGVVRRRA
jgi:PEP-CTERM motif-containing protein